MKVAIAILNWNGKKLLQRFLPSVIKNSHEANLFVIDNASDDGSTDYIKQNHPEVHLIQLNANYGFAGGYNRGLKKIDAGLICLLNNDVMVKENWLTPILDHFKTHPKTAFAQPHIMDLNHPKHFEYAGAAGGFVDRLGYPYCRGRVFKHIEKDVGQYDEDKKIFWASGACFFIRKSKFDFLGGFDEDFFAHMEEIDLCWRAFNKNLEVYSLYKSKVYHLGGGTLSLSPKKTFLNFRNNLYLLLKNLPEKRFLRISERIILDGLVFFLFLFKLEFKNALAILKAHFSFYKNFTKIACKRYNQSSISTYYDIKLLPMRYLFTKKKKILHL